MKREDKIKKKKSRSLNRATKNKLRNKGRRSTNKLDCPSDVELRGVYGTCDCGGKNYSDCLGDI